MELHKLLVRQIKKFIPEGTDNTQLLKFAKAISDSYFAYERDKELSNHAFSLSEKEYDGINQKLKSEIETKKISIAKLKETINKIDDQSGLIETGDDLVSIVEYVEQLVAKRKTIENELTENVKRMTSLISNLHSGILMENEKREIVFTNEIFCRMFGIDARPAELIGVDCSGSAEMSKLLFVNPEQFIKDIDCLLKDRKLVKGDILELKDGRYYERDFVPIFIDKEYRGHLWNYSDITQKKKAEHALAASEEKYRSIIANMNLGLLEVDNDDLIQFCNQSFMDISGFSLDEIKGKRAALLFMSDKAEQKLEEKRKIRLEGKSDSFEVMVKNKRGETRWWLISGAPNYNDKGEIIGSIGIHLDITEQKRLERELEIALEKAQIASVSKEAFLANMSHEIRTPLNAIIGMVRELGRENLTPKQNVYLSNSETAAKHLLSMVNNILDMSKIEAGEIDFDNKDFSLESIVNMVQSILHIRAKEKNIELRTILSTEIKPALIGDSSRIRQVLINIIGNAIKFTEKGFVELKVEVEEMNETFQQISFRIEDTGIGMSEEFIASIFDKFSQEELSNVKKVEGTGLGMAITKEIINMMGGLMHVSSEKGKGTVVEFQLLFPIGDQSKILSKKEVIIDRSLEGFNCLLVEDNEMNRLIASQSLQYFGCNVIEAADGKIAIDILGKQKFDFILMDIQMPVMDGIECTKYIREHMKSEIPIIALTANAFKSDIEQYLSIGMNDFVTKPFDEPSLFNAISAVLHLETAEEEANDTIEGSGNELPAPKLYDLSQINDIAKGNDAFVAKMIKLFVEQSKNSIVEMNTAFENENFVGISKIAHRMKPGIENMGIKNIIQTVKELEIGARVEEVDKPAIGQLIMKIEGELLLVIGQLESEEFG